MVAPPSETSPFYDGPKRVFIGTIGPPPSYRFPASSSLTTKAGSTSISVSWPDVDGVTVNYRVSVTPAHAPTSTTSSNSTTLTGLSPATTYTVKVESLTPGAAVADTLTASVTTDAVRSTLLTALVSAGGTVGLSWEADNVADSYEVVATPVSGGTDPVGPFSVPQIGRAHV